MGLGGLGHMAVKFGVAFGCEVYVISRSRSKEELAKKMGAKAIIPSADQEEMKKYAGVCLRQLYGFPAFFSFALQLWWCAVSAVLRTVLLPVEAVSQSLQNRLSSSNWGVGAPLLLQLCACFAANP